MKKFFSKRINSYLARQGFNKISNIIEMKDGINSKVYKFVSENKSFILKVYNNKNNSRIKRELLFYRYLNKTRNQQVVKPINFDVNLNLAIYPFIEGVKIKRVSNREIFQMANFINNINKKKSKINLPIAVDGIQNRSDHLKLCEIKLKNLKSIKFKSNIEKKCKNFLNKKLIPKFKYLKKSYKQNHNLYLLNLNLKKKKLIVSPSDFGFHNAIKLKNRLYIIDFEFAGLDDPIKLICDFLCQPDQFINNKQKKYFLEMLSLRGYSLEELKYYTEVYLPFHKIKWCCIILNIFKDKIKSNKNLTMLYQLNKARTYFKKNF
jgi:thiamine kinase-like enzyme